MFMTVVRITSVGRKSRHAEGNGPQAANLVFGGYRAFIPGVGFTGAFIIDKAQALALEILEVEGEAAVAFGYLFG